MNLQSRIFLTPPVLVRILARTPNGRRGLTDYAISRDSGIPYRYAVKIGRMRSWDGVPVGVMFRYMAACNVTFDHWEAQKSYIKRYANRQLPHIKSNPRLYAQLFAILGQ